MENGKLKMENCGVASLLFLRSIYYRYNKKGAAFSLIFHFPLSIVNFYYFSILYRNTKKGLFVYE